eukprot:CAMPEP_0182454448 /NCGR_PEP_ID=MMETSP1319-20130603/1082_1 /TAXON_ID=172717 /ORGANISM="Bolidomonas pacifica, Strain RCC208" /LENGTH=234 /DNA_ID=CAMNT_0024652463 /DNA_START=193 /DNA_END=894 /DNA_ORIENTATION=+
MSKDVRPLSPTSQVLSDYDRATKSEIEKIEPGTNDWKSHILPLARIKKIMKSEDEIAATLNKQKLMISSEGPIFFSKACSMFIGEVAIRSWMATCEGKRRTVQKTDVQTALNRSDMFDFLIDIVPRLPGSTPVETSGEPGGGFVGDEEIPTVDPSHGYMLQAITRNVQQESMSAVMDPNLVAMMNGFGGGGVGGVGTAGTGVGEEEQRVLMEQWQAAATENLKENEKKRKADCI